MAVPFLKMSGLFCGSYLLTKQFIMKTDPKFSEQEAAGFFIGAGIWNLILSQLWKKGITSIENEKERKKFGSQKVINFVRITGLLYSSVGYFGYVQKYRQAHYVGVLSCVLCIWAGSNMMFTRPKRDFMFYVGLTDVIKGIGYIMMLYHVPLK
eukprot:91604_1